MVLHYVNCVNFLDGGNANYNLNTHPVIGTSSAQSWQAKYLRSHRQNLTV
jgi:hypothetical protein